MSASVPPTYASLSGSATLSLAVLCSLLVVVAACTPANSDRTESIETVEYPDTPTGDVVDDYFGTEVADPYRWLEELDSEDTASWVSAQNAVSQPKR